MIQARTQSMDGFLLIVHVFVYVNTAGVEDPIVREHFSVDSSTQNLT